MGAPTSFLPKRLSQCSRHSSYSLLVINCFKCKQSALEQEAAELKEGITAQAEDGMRAQRFVSLVRRNGGSFDIMAGAVMGQLTVISADVVIIRVIDFLLGGGRLMMGQLVSAVGAVEKPGQRIGGASRRN